METSHAEMESNLCFARDVTRKPPTRVWSQHCITQHSKVNSKVNADYGDEDDEEEEYDDDDDDGSRSKTQPKAKAGAKKTRRLKKGPAAKKKIARRS